MCPKKGQRMEYAIVLSTNERNRKFRDAFSSRALASLRCKHLVSLFTNLDMDKIINRVRLITKAEEIRPAKVNKDSPQYPLLCLLMTTAIARSIAEPPLEECVQGG